MPVRLLEDALVNQIAAGEVIERPASVVKELVENALDAGATDIQVELKEGGRALISVVDNGSGMVRDDAMMALERHATSKIRTSDDLARVRSLGFRGEALPSIGSVSRFELLTRPEGEELGTRVRIEGGQLRDVRDAGAAPGTEVRVRNLFFNVPVRRRFLRTSATEVSHCLDAIVREALPRPDVAFSVRHGGRVVLDAPVAADVASRAQQLLGADAAELQHTEFSADGVDVRAWIAPPATTRGSARQARFLYVNGRFVRDPLLGRAVREAYRGRVAAGRYPLVVVQLSIDPLRVDVNVHPSKVEVRFREPRDVGYVLTSGLRAKLETLPGTVKDQPWQRRPQAPSSEPLPFPRPLPAHPDDGPMARGPVRQEPAQPPPGPPPAPRPAAPSLVAEATTAEGQEDGRVRAVGVVRDRVLLAESGQDLLLIDILRARAAVAAAELQREPLALGGPMRMLVPQAFSVGDRVLRSLAKREEALGSHGVEIASHGAGEVLVRAAPAGLRGVDWAALLPELASTEDLVAALSLAHAAVQPPPSAYGRRALLAALDELGLLDQLARRVPLASLLGET